jgi:hypothetical protein
VGFDDNDNTTRGLIFLLSNVTGKAPKGRKLMAMKGHQEFIKSGVLFIYFYRLEMSYYQGSMSLTALLGPPMLKLHKTSLPKPS